VFAEAWARAKALRKAVRDEQKWLEEAADMGTPRLKGYKVADDYYEGDHRVQLTTREKEYLQASGLPYCENFCETIVDTHAARLMVTGFGCRDSDWASYARGLWERNRMDAEQGKVHEGMVKYGDHFVIAEADEENGRARLVPNRPQQVKAVYDSGDMMYAVKVWTTERKSESNPEGRTIRRMNIYWPDAIEKWWTPASNEGHWGAFRQGGTDEGNVVFWTMDGTPDGEPIGIPVIHFANKPNPHYGRSVLRSPIPLQDATNKSLIDLFWVMDAQGWPQQWGTGVTAASIVRHPGSLWTTEVEGGKFGQLDPADPEKAIKSIESQYQRVSAISGTPLHLMLAGGTLPSGESLKTSESGLTTRTVSRQYAARHRWVDAIVIGARIEKAFRKDGDPPELDKLEEAPLSTRWERAETRQQVDEANIAILWDQLGVSRDTILSRLGFDPVEEAEKRKAQIDSGDTASDELLRRAREMQDRPAGTIPTQAPIRSEEAGGGEQPAQNPANRRTRT
jgi:hypothetical protein